MNTTKQSGVFTPLPQHPKYGSAVAYTLSPDPRHFRSHDPCEQYHQLLMTLFQPKRLKRALSKYYFVPELRSDGNVHIHGVYYIKNAYEYHRWFLPASKQWGFIKCKTHRVDTYWTECYMHKEILDIYDVLDHNEYGIDMPIPLHSETLHDYYVNMEPILAHATKHQIMKATPKKILKYNIKKYFK